MRVLLTAFEPYDEWSENSSWLALKQLLVERPHAVDLVTRRYPVDLDALKQRLEDDLQKSPDAILHLGQSPGAATIKLEAVALNIAGCVGENGQELPELVGGGALAYKSQMPLGRWSEKLQEARIPAVVSYHAGTFLCNATMYWSHHWYAQQGKAVPPIGFVHMPLATEQVAGSGRNLASLPVSTLAAALGCLLQDLASSTSNSVFASETIAPLRRDTLG